ncbi:hypothetical protein BGX34_009625 [Mortierella sp. NVP85]|nr:hypothetical protein BGX34_009625 [Mortierella sp. NVP85]
MSSPFEGKVIQLRDDGYDSHAYQYATSTHKDKGTMNPALILYALDDDDVIKAIKFAHGDPAQHLPPRAIAIRTGGHQYSGASSTSGINMVIDLSDTYDDFVWKDEDYTLVKVGIGLPLGKLNSLLKGAGRFVPHGQCAYVHLGGHCQTGGYGQLIRSFGLTADHVQKYRLITADGKVVSVRRDSEDPKIKDLFYALAGGSPGNFGVVTHVTLKVHKDQDHRKSYGYRCEVAYSRELLEKLLEFSVQMDIDNRSADYDLCITFLSTRERPGNNISKIIVFSQWANLGGSHQECDDSFFQDLRKICKGHILSTAGGSLRVVDGSLPLSELSSHWLFPIAREFEYPYVKRAYATRADGQYLKKQKWAKWVSERVEEIESMPKRTCYIAAQIQYSGGRGSKESAMKKNGAKGDTSISWRDSSYIFPFDIFYKPEGKETALKWQERNDREAIVEGKFSKQEDRRYIWGSHDLDLIAAKKFYFDSDEKFNRLVSIKNRVDPQGLFTPNDFCITRRPTSVQPPATQAPAPSLHMVLNDSETGTVDVPYLKGCRFMTHNVSKILGKVDNHSKSAEDKIHSHEP